MKVAIILTMLTCISPVSAQSKESITIHSSNDSLNLKDTIQQEQINVTLKEDDELNAYWIQIRLGYSSANVTRASMIEGEISFSVRLHHMLFSAGISERSTEAWSVTSFWGLYGYTIYLSWLDVSANAGIGGFQSKYNPEIEYGIEKSPIMIGLLGRIEVLFHLPWVLGVGGYLTGAYSSHVNYYTVGCVLALGVWNLK